MSDEEPSASEYQEAARLRRALRQFARRSEELCRAEGLTPQQYLLLLMIKGAPDGSERSTVTELVDALQLSQSAVTELVNRAEGASLLLREPSPVDRRVMHLVLTAAGTERLGRVVGQLGPERAALRRLIDGRCRT
jgi:DNA-binding MarR family transcriptional regulator